MDSPELSGAHTGLHEPATLFNRAADEIIANAYTIQSTNYDNGPERKFLHSGEHPLTLEQRAEPLEDILGFTSHQRKVTELAIAGHDTVIEVQNPDSSNLLGMIIRNRGAREGDQPSGAEGNEGQSALYIEGEMRKANHDAGREIFTEKDILTAKNAVEVTYPLAEFKTFEDSPFYQNAANAGLKEVFDKLKERDITSGLLISQPHLETPLEAGQMVDLEAFVIAQVDLAAAGSAEKTEFFREGDNEMRELYANLTPNQMQRLKSGDSQEDRVDREKVSGAFLKWLYTQPGFAAWQGIRFEKIMHHLRQNEQITEEQENGIRKTFSKYKENALGALERADKTKSTFEELKNEAGEKAAFTFLAETMGYEKNFTPLPEEGNT